MSTPSPVLSPQHVSTLKQFNADPIDVNAALEAHLTAFVKTGLLEQVRGAPMPIMEAIAHGVQASYRFSAYLDDNRKVPHVLIEFFVEPHRQVYTYINKKPAQINCDPKFFQDHLLVIDLERASASPQARLAFFLPDFCPMPAIKRKGLHTYGLLLEGQATLDLYV